jgi:hypothetical protein
MAKADVYNVYVFDFNFSIYRPGEGEIESPQILVGDTIRWVWLNDFHDVVSVAGQAEQWQSPLFLAGDTFEYTFGTPGVFWYYCSPHGFDIGNGTAGGMAGTIEVQPVPAPGGLVTLAAGGLLKRRRR